MDDLVLAELLDSDNQLLQFGRSNREQELSQLGGLLHRDPL